MCLWDLILNHLCLGSCFMLCVIFLTLPGDNFEGTLAVTLRVPWGNFESNLGVTLGVLWNYFGHNLKVFFFGGGWTWVILRILWNCFGGKFWTTLKVVWGHLEGTLGVLCTEESYFESNLGLLCRYLWAVWCRYEAYRTKYPVDPGGLGSNTKI